MTIDSPFDYEDAVMIYLPTDIPPEPNDSYGHQKNHRRYHHPPGARHRWAYAGAFHLLRATPQDLPGHQPPRPG